MPFIRKTDSQGSQPPIDGRKIFIGRTGELLFFVQNILKPEEPKHNIISIWGQGGVGKSTLLARFIDEAHSAGFQDYCLTAIVDERQITPASIMEKFADQLHISGDFGKALRQYKEALRKLQAEQETLQDRVLPMVPDFTGAAVEGVPFVGPVLREGVKATTGHLLERHHTIQQHRDKERLEDPVDDLTRAFVEGLNRLTNPQVTSGSLQAKRHRRVILFFDTFEQLAAIATPWLLDYFLQANISNNVVLVVAGRDPIERSTPAGPKRWLPYLDDQIIYSISLDSFTEIETRAYLAKRGITDSDRIATIWQLSGGLPLYLSLLTSNPRGEVDPTADVVANFLRWIPEQEQIKLRLVLDAALLSKPFNQDDLEAFTYLPENERVSIYDWLIGQPFVRSSPQDGRYSYHELAQELFSRHLYQRSQKAYYATRRVLADHYERLRRKIEEGNENLYRSSEWLELALALTSQLFSLPDEASHIKAIEQVLDIYQRTLTEQEVEIMRVLRELSKEQSTNQLSLGARQTVRQLLSYFGADRGSQERLAAANVLVEKALRKTSYSSRLQAALYSLRGWSYFHLKEYHQALVDFDRALELDPDFIDAHDGRGWAYFKLHSYQRAIEHFDRMIELDPESPWTYHSRGWVYYWLKEYQRAIEDFDHALELDPRMIAAYNGRGWARKGLKEYQRAVEDFNRIIELDPNFALAYYSRGRTYEALKNYEQAIADFNRALELDPSHHWATYNSRGYTYLWLKDLKHAEADFIRSWELDPSLVRNGWMVHWTAMCQDKPDSAAVAQLEAIVAIDPQLDSAYICRGTAQYLRKRFEEALAELEQAIQLEPERWDAYFWKGMAYASLGRYEEAMSALEKALEVELPPILLTPLRWLEQDRPDFYERYVVPLFVRFDLV